MTFTEFVTLIITALGGATGITYLVKRLIDAGVSKIRTETQIALVKAESERDSEKSLYEQMAALTGLIQQFLTQQAQTFIQNSQLEADRTAAQNNLASAVREAVDGMREHQRTVTSQNEEIIRVYRADLDDFKAMTRRDVNAIFVGQRTLQDSFLYLNTQFSQILEKMNNTVDTMTSAVVKIHNDTVSVRNLYTSGQEKLEDIVNLVTDMRNMTVTVTQDEETAKKMLIPTMDELRPQMSFARWLNTLPQWVEDQASSAVTQPIPDLQDEINQSKSINTEQSAEEQTNETHP